jgi:hypothetical protein
MTKMSTNIRSAAGASLDTLFAVADRARARRKLSPEDVMWVAKIATDQLNSLHLGYPKGVYCCVQCTLATIPVLDAGAIRYFDCRELSRAAKLLIQKRKWRFATRVDPQMERWALGSGGTIE